MRRLAAALVVFLAVGPASALKPAHKRRRALKLSPYNYRMFVPSPDSLLEQNAAIDAMGLPRIKDSKTLLSMEKDGTLARITENRYVRVSPGLKADRRYVQPRVDLFLQELGEQFYEEFGHPIQVDSAVRTVRTQLSIRRWNGNAAPAHGEKASAHLAGVAVDLQRRELTIREIRFLQWKLLYLANLKMVIVEEELKNGSCFHIVVTGDYPFPPPLSVVYSGNGVGLQPL